MRISGVATMRAPAGRVWTALTDPAVLVAAIPGCERLERTGPGAYRFTVAAKVASVDGIYAGEVCLTQQQEPSSFALTVRSAGAPGTVSSLVQVRLADTAEGTTEVSYDAEAEIGGLIAGVGQRLLSGVAKRMAGEFVSSVNEALAGTGVVSPAARQADPGPLPVPTAPDSTVPKASPPPVPVSKGPQSSSLRAKAGFARGMLAGAAVTLAGVAAARLIGRKDR